MFIFASFSDEVQSIYIFILTGELQKLASSESDTSHSFGALCCG